MTDVVIQGNERGTYSRARTTYVERQRGCSSVWTNLVTTVLVTALRLALYRHASQLEEAKRHRDDGYHNQPGDQCVQNLKQIMVNRDPTSIPMMWRLVIPHP